MGLKTISGAFFLQGGCGEIFCDSSYITENSTNYGERVSGAIERVRFCQQQECCEEVGPV